MKSVRFLAAGAAAALSLAGCHFGGGGSGTPGSPPSSLGATAPSSSGMTSASMAPTGMSSTPVAPTSMAPTSMAPVRGHRGHPPRHCTDLGVSVGVASGTAGSTYVTLVFVNDARGTTCTVEGYPGVSLTTGMSTMDQVGASAVRDANLTPARHVLRPGASVTALLRIADVGNFPAAAGHVTATGFIQVYPPDNHAPQYLAFASHGTAVASVKYLTVGPAVAG